MAATDVQGLIIQWEILLTLLTVVFQGLHGAVHRIVGG